MNTEGHEERLEDLLASFERHVARFRKTKEAFFRGQGGMFLGLALVYTFHAYYYSSGMYPSQYWWTLIGAAAAGFFTCSLPGLGMQRMEMALRLIRSTGEHADLSEREVERRIKTIGRRELRGGLLSPSFLGMVCLVFAMLWIFLGGTAIARWESGIVVFFGVTAPFGLIAFLADKHLGKYLRVDDE